MRKSKFGAHLCDIVVVDHLARFWVRQRVTVSTVNPAHLRTLALLGANLGFFFNFSGGRLIERRSPIMAGTSCQLACWGGRPATLRLQFVYRGGDGAQWVCTHNPRVSLQNLQPGQGHLGGRLWPARRARPLAYFRGPAPHRQLSGGEVRHRRSLAPVWGKPSHTLLKFRTQGWHGAADPGTHRSYHLRLS